MADFVDLTVWEKRLLGVIRDKAPKEHKKLVRQAGNLLRKYVRRATQKVSGKLRRSYRTKIKGDTVTVYTDKFYAKMVEEGHKTKDGKGFVPGKFYLKKSLEETERDLPVLLKEFVRHMGKELGMDVSG